MNSSSRSRQHAGASPSRFRLVFLAVIAAAFLLIPAAQAFAEEPHLKLNIVGSGSGEVESVEVAEYEMGPGEPPIACSYDGATQSGECENVPSTLFSEPAAFGEQLVAHPAPGSEVVSWSVDQGINNGGCPLGGSIGNPCQVYSIEEGGIEWEITVEFALSGPPSFKLNLNTSGNGSGSFECEVEATAGPCEAEYEEGTEVTVLPVPGAGSEFSEFTNENGGECTGASCGFTMDAEHTANAEYILETFELTVNESGPGALNVECESGPCASLTEIPYGTSVTVTAESDVGAETTVFEGTGSAAGCEAEGSPCNFTMEEASSVTGEFENEEESLTIEEPGTGSGTVECNGGSCAGPWFYGETIEVTATPTGGSTLGPVSGTGSASSCSASPCSFEITEATTISVTFNPAGAATLTVIKGGNGSGTVQSTTGGINCGTTCSASFGSGETVTLKETPASAGSVFLAWSGNCTPISATECKVEVQPGGTTVTATFAAVPVITGEPSGANCEYGGTKIEYAGSTQYVCNGLVGEDGEEGKGVEIINSAPGCPDGGITVQVEGEPSTAKEICNGEQGVDGEQGEDGERGEIGFPGPEGPPGSTGPQGPAGSNGAQGAQGAQGVQGPEGKQGPRGKRGPAGRVSVTCKVIGAKKVSCKVKQSKANSRANRRNRLSWRLMSGGQTQSHGRTTLHRLNRVLSHLRPGQYALEVNGIRTAVLIPVCESHGGHRRS
jgi:hypothetical protein